MPMKSPAQKNGDLAANKGAAHKPPQRTGAARLQRTLGNQAFGRWLSHSGMANPNPRHGPGAGRIPESSFGSAAVPRTSPVLRWPIQPRLHVGPVNDHLEREADQVADRVMRMPGGAISPRASLPTPHSSPVGGFDAGPAFTAQLAASTTSGEPLSAGLRGFMETRIGADFSGVRLQTGPDAAQLNRAIGARAFTHGRDIYL